MNKLIYTWCCITGGLPMAARAHQASVQDTAVHVSVQAHWPADQFQSGRDAIELTLSRPLDAQAERLALLIGTLDVSSLIEVRGQRVRYRPAATRLPSGESEVTVYTVSSRGDWQEIGRFALKVRTRTGLDQARVNPVIDISGTRQIAASAAENDAPTRAAHQELTVRLGIDGQVARQGWQITTQANALGVTEKAQRLRWSELQSAAPAVDLSDYRIRVAEGRSHLTLGSITTTSHRYLLNNFGSRGLATALAAGSFAVFDAALLNGTNVVGWSNPLGLMRPAHQVVSGALSLELLPRRPGAIHMGISGLNGSVLPQISINRGSVTDAEKNSGLGIDVTLSDATQRIRFTGGYARSRYLNPPDPLLSGDTTLVPVQAALRSARHADLEVQILKAVPLTQGVQATLAGALRHERVDPLFRSIGSSVQADAEDNGLELTGSIGSLSLQANAAQSRDNLADIASILTSRTRNRSVTGTLPLGTLLGRAQSAIWPTLNAGWQRVRQFGTALPSDGDFSASHIPDQLNTIKTASVNWNRGGTSLTYRWNRSLQDNRQTGRERADFRAIVHGLSLSLAPVSQISSSVELSDERQNNIEIGARQQLRRFSAAVQWQPLRHTTLSGSLSHSRGRDEMVAQETHNTEQQLELSQGFTLYRRFDSGTQGRLFLRYARTRAALLPFETQSLLAPRIVWTLNAGGSFRLY